ncbi:MAG: hypothetical protein H0W72_06445 [Planctomycetes bacterium]|nr:hypothetical protein [Planctomycetota bacterium]
MTRAPLTVLVLLALTVAVLGLAGCGATARGPYAPDAQQRRDIHKAEATYQKALAELADGDRKDAEQLLRETLGFDLYHGPAHNNLGVLLLEQDRLYDASEEFQWARKLLPGHPEPRVNLAIALERGGKHADAIEAAKAALEVQPGHLGAIKAIALISVTERMTDDGTVAHLDAIVERAPEAQWREWARGEKVRLEGAR